MKLAIFDFDGTLFPQDTLPFLFSQWKELKYSRFKYIMTYMSVIILYIRYKLGLGSNEKFKITAIKRFNRLFYGMTEQQVIKYFEHCSLAIKDLLKTSVVEEVYKAQEDGYHTVLLSGAYNYLLEGIKDHLSFDTVIGTKIYFANNVYDKQKESDNVYGSIKLNKILAAFNNEHIDWQSSRAYSDSYSDVEILKTVGHPVAVAPDNKLKAIANEKKWKIII